MVPEQKINSSILFKGKQLLIILALKDSSQNWYTSTLAKAAGATYVHTCNFINECIKLGIVTSEKHGKIKEIKLTEKGTKLADMLSNAYNIINSTSAEQNSSEKKGEIKG
jgi:predicted transcriptional regulator